METELIRADLLPARIPTVVMLLVAVMVMAGWPAVHHWFRLRQPGTSKVVRTIVQVGAGTVAVWMALQLMARFFMPTSTWPLVVLALLGAVAAEMAILCYAFERQSMDRRVGSRVVCLRVAAILATVFLLSEPVLEYAVDRRLEKHVVILLDESASMHLADPQLTAREKLDLAILFNVADGALRHRPPLDQAQDELQAAQALLQGQMARLDLALRADAAVPDAVWQTAKADLNDALDVLETARVNGLESIDSIGVQGLVVPEPAATTLAAARTGLSTNLPPAMAAVAAAADAEPEQDAPMAAAVKAVREALAELLVVSDAIRVDVAKNLHAVDAAFLASLNDDVRTKVDALAAVERRQAAQRIVEGAQGHIGLLEALAQMYETRLIRFPAEPREARRLLTTGEVEDATPPGEDSLEDSDSIRRTDITAALEYVLDEVPAGQLAGVVLLSDMRHNGREGLSAAARTLGGRGAPLYPVVLGSAEAPLDLAVVGVDAPESIYEGDRLLVKADLKLDGVKGQNVTVNLHRGLDLIATETVTVPDERYRTEVRFVDETAASGFIDYEVKIEPLAEEVVTENNSWPFQIAVSDDRKNVLLVDGTPRWEFRYLRNLFYGRDKSVHLQYVLTDPVDIARPDNVDAPHPAPVVASASRKFGEAEADLLPVKRDEWRKFDVIILGDIGPHTLTAEILDEIQYCVVERGATLIVIAGPSAMPHAFDSPVLNELLPVTFARKDEMLFESPNDAFRLALTPAGRQHLVTQLSAGTSENALLWESLPPLHWRHPGVTAKLTATVLAYAVELDGRPQRRVTAAASLDEASRQIDRMQRAYRENALIVTQQQGRGKVIMLNFDRTWRLRYRAGDTYHHRFWGQVLNWGAGENLRSGGDFVRLGTDRITYSPNETIQVLAKVMNADYIPVTDARLRVGVYLADRKILEHVLQYRPDSQGMYEGEIGPFAAPGRYRLELVGRDVEAILAAQNAAPVTTEILVATAFNPVELSELSADHEGAERMAKRSGGQVIRPHRIARLHTAFGPGTESQRTPADVTLWDHGLLMLIILGCLSAEWLLRRKEGLP